MILCSLLVVVFFHVFGIILSKMLFISLINDHFNPPTMCCGVIYLSNGAPSYQLSVKNCFIFLILESNLGLKRANTLHYIGMQTMSVLKKPDMAGKWTILRSWNSSKTKLEFKELNPGL